MASVVLLSGFSTIFINIKGHRSLLCGQDSDEVIAAWKKLGDKGILIAPDVEAAKALDNDTNSEADFNEFMESMHEAAAVSSSGVVKSVN